MWSRSACTFAVLFLAASNVELVAPRRAAAETLPAVLAKAYQNNPQLNAQRAYVRQTEEQVNVATAGYLPKVEASASTGPRHTDGRFRETSIHKREQLTTSTVGVTASQTLFDGFRTPNQVSAAEGKEIGFVTEVVPQGKALEEARRWAGMILECSPMAIKATKETVMTGLNTADFKAAFDHKVPGIGRLMASADHKEGPKAFAEKRKPVWKNEP
jgi:hypothetical protein